VAGSPEGVCVLIQVLLVRRRRSRSCRGVQKLCSGASTLREAKEVAESIVARCVSARLELLHGVDDLPFKRRSRASEAI
jgi:hypothetical protein